ncbi:hypothetical protein [Streptomyces sp. NPDC005336]|uniref:hypothetical protein n=1 Tax=Streptomyces sp. NPDC005336 TaxID=3157035 RepID=UPI0033BA8585
MALAFVTFAVAQLVYTTRAGKSIGVAVRFARSHPREIVVLNVLTLSSWLFMFMALQRIEASVESAIFQGVVALGGFLLATVWSGQRFGVAARVGVLAATAALGLLVLARLSQTLSAPKHDASALVGVVLALIAGASGALYIHYSSALHSRTEVSANTVLCLRFVLLLMVTGAASAGETLKLLESDQGTILRLLALSVAFVVVPTFLLQFAIARLPSVRVSVATPFVAVIALGSEYAVRPWGNIAVPVLVLAASAALVFTNVALSSDLARSAFLSPRNEENPAPAPAMVPDTQGETRS